MSPIVPKNDYVLNKEHDKEHVQAGCNKFIEYTQFVMNNFAIGGDQEDTMRRLREDRLMTMDSRSDKTFLVIMICLQWLWKNSTR